MAVKLRAAHAQGASVLVKQIIASAASMADALMLLPMIRG